jgi:molybdopterin converting factor small subunit
MRIDVHIPSLLQASIGVATIAIDAATVREALAQMRAHPKLGPLIFDEANTIRRHVLVFVNDTATKHLPSLDVALAEGDRIAVVQAVSGGV